jgi:hypothetical protein
MSRYEHDVYANDFTTYFSALHESSHIYPKVFLRKTEILKLMIDRRMDVKGFSDRGEISRS